MVKAIYIVDKGATLAALQEGQEFSSPEAIALSEAYLLENDLTTSLKNILLIIDRHKYLHESPEEMCLAEALYRDAVVQFVGCFGRKPNQLSKERVLGGIEGAMESMSYLEDIRDSYAAHRFGPTRQNFIVVVPMDGGGFGFKSFRLTLCVPAENVLPAYVDLINVALVAAKARIAELHEVVRLQLAELGSEGIAKLPGLKVRTPGADELTMTRTDFRTGKKAPRRGRRGLKGQRP